MQLLHFLLRYPGSPRGLLIGAYREEELRPDAQLTRFVKEVERAGWARRLALQPLSHGDLEALLIARLGSPCSPELIDALRVRSGGNPFFALQMLELLREEGDLGDSGIQATVPDNTSIRLPTAVREAILQRLSDLGRDEREALTLGAVLGREFAYLPIEAMWQGDERSLFEALDRAVDIHLLQETGGGYAFHHPLLWDVVYQRTPPARRALLHERAGHALESIYADQLEPHVPELAYHFAAAGRACGNKALHYLLLAGDREEGVLAHEEAERRYQQALQLAREMGDRLREAEALEKLGGVQAFVGRYGSSLEQLETAARMYHDLGDVDAEGLVVARIGWVHMVQGTIAEAFRRVQSLADALEPLGPSQGLAALTLTLSHLHHRVGDYMEQMTLARRACELAQAVGDENILSEAENFTNSALSFLGKRQPAALPDPDPTGFPDGADDFWYLDMRAERTRLRGELSRSKQYQVRALSAAKKRGDMAEIAFQQQLLGRTAFLMGEWQEAREHMEDTLRLGHRLSAVQGNLGPRMDLGDLSLHEGDWTEASRWLHEALDLALSSDDLYALRVIQGRLAKLDILQGRPDAAVERLTPLLDRPGFEETLVTPLLAVLASAHLEKGNLDTATETIENALTRARREHIQEHLVDTLGVRAKAFMARMCWKKAEETINERLSLTSGMPYPYARATSLHDLGLLSLQTGNIYAALGHLKQAVDVFQHLGAKKDIERTKEALANLDPA